MNCHLVTRNDNPFLNAVKQSPGSVVVGVVCFFSVWSILGLAGFHTYLTTSNQTTNEDVSVFFVVLILFSLSKGIIISIIAIIINYYFF